jgi:hypothetical protein
MGNADTDTFPYVFKKIQCTLFQHYVCHIGFCTLYVIGDYIKFDLKKKARCLIPNKYVKHNKIHTSNIRERCSVETVNIQTQNDGVNKIHAVISNFISNYNVTYY